MSYKNEYLEEIKKINKLIEESKNDFSDELLQDFSNYIKSIKDLGSFKVSEWKCDWRNEIYKLGEHFKVKTPEIFFKILDEEIVNSNTDAEKEVLEFIKSEIFLNFFPIDDSLEYLNSLSKKFKMNADFYNSLSLLYGDKNNEELSLKNIKSALKIDKKNQNWLKSIYNIEYGIGTKLINDKKHEEANVFIQNIINSKFYLDNRSGEFQNFFIFLKQRNDDQILIEKKLKEINRSSKKTVEDLFDKSRINVVEILGFFTAIIAFIFATISISIKFDVTSALIILCSLGLIMILFLITISIVFSKSEKKIIEDIRIWALIILIIAVFSLIKYNKYLI